MNCTASSAKKNRPCLFTMISAHCTKMKCGYCGWIMSDDMKELVKHKCFATYDAEVDIIVVDDNKVATMNTLETAEKQQWSSSSGASKIVDVLQGTTKNGLASLSADAIDELLIEAVEQKRPLWDHSKRFKNRSKLKTDPLWEEVSNIMGGIKSPAECKVRWKYLRDYYTKAKKSIKNREEDGRPAKTGFRFYNKMRFLDANDQSGSKGSSLLMELLEKPDPLSVPVDSNIETFTRLYSQEKINDVNVRSDSSVASSADSSASCNSQVSKQLHSEEIAHIEADLMSNLKKSEPNHDVVHSFCDVLGDILRRLPYRKRRELQMKILTLAIEVEKSTEFDMQY